MHRAKELALLANIIGAAEALEIGLVNELADSGALFDLAMARADRAALLSGSAIERSKLLLKSSYSASLQQQLEYEAKAIAELASNKEGREGIKAFIEKRTPSYR